MQHSVLLQYLYLQVYSKYSTASMPSSVTITLPLCIHMLLESTTRTHMNTIVFYVMYNG